METASSAANNNNTTTAVNRSLSDLHAPTWIALLLLNISARTILFHPINLSIARKRVSGEDRPLSVPAMIMAAYRGGNNNNNNNSLGKGGIRGLYRGVGAALLCNVLGEISFLITLEVLKERISRLQGRLQSPSSNNNNINENEKGKYDGDSASTAIGAMVGDAVALMAVTPFVIIANKQMTSGFGLSRNNQYKSVLDTAKEVWSTYQETTAINNKNNKLNRIKNGFRGLYQGTSAGILRIPSAGLWWYVYSKSKEIIYSSSEPFLIQQQKRFGILNNNDNDNNNNNNNNSSIIKRALLSASDNPIINALAGVVASTITILLFNPLQVIQTRQQALPTSHIETLMNKNKNKNKINKSYFSTVYEKTFKKTIVVGKDIASKEGWRSFFKGVTANGCVAVMDGVLFSLLFELTKLGSDVKVLKEFFGVTPPPPPPSSSSPSLEE